jgi:hypothetical protein
MLLPTTPEASYRILVMPMALPKSESFPSLTQFLQLKNVHPLFDAFLSLILASGIPDLDQPGRCDTFIAKYPSILAQDYTMQCLASQAVKAYGLWHHL